MSEPLTDGELAEIRQVTEDFQRPGLFIQRARTIVHRLLDTIAAERAEVGRLRLAAEACGEENEALETENEMQGLEIAGLKQQLSLATRTERERCAKIARGYQIKMPYLAGGEYTDADINDAINATCREARKQIAQAIEAEDE